MLGSKKLTLKAEMCVFESFIHPGCSFFGHLDSCGRVMSDKQPDCHTWNFRVRGGGGVWNNDYVEIRLLTPPVLVPEAPLTLGSVCQFSIPSPEQNNREHFIYSVCPHNRAAQPLCSIKVLYQGCPNYGLQANCGPPTNCNLWPSSQY